MPYRPPPPTKHYNFDPPIEAEDETSGDPFFARLRGFDIECPRCAKLFTCTPGRKQAYFDPRTSRWRCASCGLCLILGVIAWSPPIGASGTPCDQEPTVRQAMELRNSLKSYWMRKRAVKKARVNANKARKRGKE